MLPRLRSVVLVILSVAPLAPLPGVAAAGLGVGAPAPFDPVKIRAVRSQESVAAAANDSVTLFVWTDLRSGNADVFAARVRHDGTVLDPNGIAVAQSGAAETGPTVSWSGSEWLVAWEKGSDVYASRVAIDGEVLDPAGFAIAAGAAVELAPAAAGLGGRHLVVWTSLTANQALNGAIVSPDGTFDVAPAVLSLGATPSDSRPALAVRGSTALVAFDTARNGGTDLYAFRLERSTAGPPAFVRVDAADIAVATGAPRVDFPAVGAGPNGWLVAWSDSRNAGTANDIFAARVSAAGAVQDAN